jgi:hypothetical protein
MLGLEPAHRLEMVSEFLEETDPVAQEQMYLILKLWRSDLVKGMGVKEKSALEKAVHDASQRDGS